LRVDDGGTPRAEFILNRQEFRDARIVVADRNFGCGSSREHAVWALYDHGIRAVIAPSFGDIFFNNSLQNGLLPVVLPASIVGAFITALVQAPGTRIKIDLEAQCVTGPDGVLHAFEIDPFRKQCLLEGADELAFTLGLDEQIDAFEKAYERKVSWL
jgi:3-isopropylmalate/(R)-2-methylmalate dehydratase small subunit